VQGRRRPFSWSALTLAIGLTATLLVAAGIRRDAERVAEEEFVLASDQAARTIEREVDGYLDELGDIGAFRAASPDASPTQFERFVRGTGIFDRLPSLAGIIFLEQVPPDELGAALDRLRVRDPDFNLVPLGARPEGRPWLLLTYYVPGSVDLELPLGADISPITSISDALASAELSGTAVVGSFQDDPLLHQIAEATDFAALDQLINVDFFLGVPVYESAPDAVDPAADEPLGWLSAPVAHFDSVLDAATSGLPAKIGVSLTVDISGVSGDDVPSISRVAERAGDAGPRADAAFDAPLDFEVHGVTWKLGVWSDERPVRTAERVALVSGLAMTVLAALLVYARVQSLSRDRAFAAAIAEREAFRRAVLDSVVEPMVVLDGNGEILAANPAWWQLRGVAADADDGPDVGRPYLGVLQGTARGGLDELAEGFERLGSASPGDTAPDRVQAVEVDLPIETSRGRRWYAVRVTPLRGRRGGSVVVHNDVTERKRAEAELELRATHDDLTGLLNRLAMENEIDRAMQRARVQESAVAALFIDLDGFKPINDTYGHAVGDDVLRAVAQRITGAVRSSDRVARLGGDEFVVLIGSLSDRTDAEQTARRVLDALHHPVDLGELVVPIAASVGVAVVDAPLDASAQSLLDLADRAMYTAKQAGGARYSLG
jgi:diguanylate cyclase (GGDEF)-like protein